MNAIETLLRYEFKKPTLLRQALTHKSAKGTSYERLELLGDSVLDLVVTEWLLDIYPNDNEGRLTQRRTHLVQHKTLAGIAADLSLNEYIKADKVTLVKHPRILEDVIEAIVGAVYLDGGITSARLVIKTLFSNVVRDMPNELRHPKGQLQELLAQYENLQVKYIVQHAGGTHAHPDWYVQCLVTGDIKYQIVGKGSSKTEAEGYAASAMLDYLESWG